MIKGKKFTGFRHTGFPFSIHDKIRVLDIPCIGPHCMTSEPKATPIA
jgi:hypothetical protein